MYTYTYIYIRMYHIISYNDGQIMSDSCYISHRTKSDVTHSRHKIDAIEADSLTS